MKFKFVIIPLFIFSCAYYNTLFNALERYDTATGKLESSTNQEVTADVRKDYQAAIDKCWKLINIHGEDSKYADDALLLIGKSHYQMKEYQKSERFLRQFIIGYPESELYDEANLWLGRSLIHLNRGEEAVNYLNNIIKSDNDDNFTAMAWFSLGELAYQRKDYDEAITNYQRCSEFADDDLMAARAQYAAGEILFDLKRYEEAIDRYDLVLDYAPSDELAFDANLKIVDCWINEKDYEAAVSALYNLMRDSRFLSHMSLLNARLGDCFAYQERIDTAEEQYLEVLKLYPRTEGSAIAAFGLAKLMEYYYAEIDSAQKLYSRVKQEYRLSEYVEAADDRAALLSQFIKLRSNIAQDTLDLYVMQTGDSSVLKQESDGKPTQKRTEPEVLASLDKNRFILAEFFLLTYQNYDSAEVAYKNFLKTSSDSLLKPKALYSLYYIYDSFFQQKVRSDSIAEIILSVYPESPYARYIRNQGKKKIAQSSEAEELDIYHHYYLEAEDYLYRDRYYDALAIFSRIAEEDSGSVWAEKARYSIAWIYEKKIADIPLAVEAYQTIVDEYPDTEMAKIARNKIQPPPEESEPAPSDSSRQTSSFQPDSVGTDSIMVESINDSLPQLLVPEEQGTELLPVEQEAEKNTDSLKVDEIR